MQMYDALILSGNCVSQLIHFFVLLQNSILSVYLQIINPQTTDYTIK